MSPHASSYSLPDDPIQTRYAFSYGPNDAGTLRNEYRIVYSKEFSVHTRREEIASFCAEAERSLS